MAARNGDSNVLVLSKISLSAASFYASADPRRARVNLTSEGE